MCDIALAVIGVVDLGVAVGAVSHEVAFDVPVGLTGKQVMLVIFSFQTVETLGAGIRLTVSVLALNQGDIAMLVIGYRCLGIHVRTMKGFPVLS